MPDRENCIVGIDLGTTNSAVGVVDTGFPVLIPGPDGSRLLPSAVSYHTEPPLVGAAARRARRAHPGRVITSVKRFMGRRWRELEAEEREVSYVLQPGADGGVLAAGREPESVSAEILRELKARAEAYLGHAVERAVITVPAYFNNAQREATIRAGTEAGLVVERILNEPTAAALSFGVAQAKREGIVAVYDLGGGTFDLSILKLHKGVFEVLATCGDTRLGGDDIDAALAGWLRVEVERQGAVEWTPERSLRLLEAAEDAKCRLSESEEARVELPFLQGEFSAVVEVPRRRLEILAARVLQLTRACCRRALQDAGLQAGQVDTLLMVGGQTRMPAVQRMAAEVFGREPDTSVNPDEAVALGAALQAGILSGALQHLVLLDVTPLSLGIETFGGLMNVIIPRNSSIPTRAGEVFTNAVDGQRKMSIRVLQGERELARDNWTLGELTLDFPPAPRGKARVGVQFELDTDGVLRVLARDLQTGEDRELRIRSAVNVEDGEVEAMVASSLEHAREDLEERRWVERSEKARRLAKLTRQALREHGGALEEAVRGELQGRLVEVEELLERGERRGLAEAVAALDHATLPLADRMIQTALGTALKPPLPSR